MESGGISDGNFGVVSIAKKFCRCWLQPSHLILDIFLKMSVLLVTSTHKCWKIESTLKNTKVTF